MDPLREFQFREGGGDGMFFKIAKGESKKIRVLTTDPVINTDKYGGTKFAFIIYNHDESKAQILNKGASIARPIQQIHADEDYGADVQKIDLKITSTSTGPEEKDVEYSVNPLMKQEHLTEEQIAEAKEINLDKIVDGIRMSEAVKNPEKTKDLEKSKPEETKESIIEDDDDIDLSEVPF